MKMDVTGVQARLFSSIEQKLRGAAEYEGKVKAYFGRLVMLLIQFLTARIDASGSRYPYLRRFTDEKDAPVERDL